MAANPLPSAQELHLSTEKKAKETIVHASGRITFATSDLLQRTIRGLIPGAKTERNKKSCEPISEKCASQASWS